MKNPLNNIMTPDEQKVIGIIFIYLIAGIVLYHLGITKVFAVKPDQEQEITETVMRDTLIQIDIRTATQSELELLPGIGPKKAAAIIAYRNKQQFQSPEELMNIKGIGPKTYQKMKTMLLPFGSSGKGLYDKSKISELSAADTTNLTTKEKKENSPPKLKSSQETIINLNTATKAELMSLSGIGEVKAQAIIDYRTKIGKFSSVEQLTEVKGIGKKTLEKNRHRLII